MVDGTGLENQHTKVSQVRILSLPPFLLYKNIKKQDIGSRASRSMRILPLPPFFVEQKTSKSKISLSQSNLVPFAIVAIFGVF